MRNGPGWRRRRPGPFNSVGLVSQWSNLKWAAGPLRRAARPAEQARPREQSPEATHYRVSLRLGNEEKAALLQRYRAGVPASDLARDFGVSRQSVNVLAEEAGLPRRINRLTEAQQQEIIDLYRGSVAESGLLQAGRLPTGTRTDLNAGQLGHARSLSVEHVFEQLQSATLVRRGSSSRSHYGRGPAIRRTRRRTKPRRDPIEPDANKPPPVLSRFLAPRAARVVTIAQGGDEACFRLRLAAAPLICHPTPSSGHRRPSSSTTTAWLLPRHVDDRERRPHGSPLSWRRRPPDRRGSWSAGDRRCALRAIGRRGRRQRDDDPREDLTATERKALAEIVGDVSKIGGLELGVAELAYALATARIVPAACCRSHLERSWSDAPVVLFAATEFSARALEPLAAATGCTFDVDPLRPGVIGVRGQSIANTMSLADAVLAEHSSFAER